MPRRRFGHVAVKSVALLIALLIGTAAIHAEEPAQNLSIQQTGSLMESVRDLKLQIQELHSALIEMRQEIRGSRAESLELRQELHETRDRLSSDHQAGASAAGQPVVLESARSSGTASATAPGSQATAEEQIAKLREDQQLLNEKIDEQYQTKVESASKYRVRLSGIALLNVFGNRGSVDNLDVPSLARPRGLL